MTTLSVLIDWFFYGFIRYIIFWIPLLTPPAVTRSMPWQWWLYASWSDWWHRKYNNGGPDEHWLQCWFRLVFGEALKLTAFNVEPYVESVREKLRQLIGHVKSSFSNLGSWLDWVEKRLGLPLPWWSSTIKTGLYWLRGKLPGSIREGWRTWTQIFDGIEANVRDWVHSIYDTFRRLASDAWNWIVYRGAVVFAWYDRVRSFVDNFRASPYWTITGWLGGAWCWLMSFRQRGRAIVLSWLGTTWSRLSTFDRSCVDFYYALWSRGWRTLSQFVDDPRAWLYAKIEQILVERW